MPSAKPHNQNIQHPFFPCSEQSNSGQKADVPEEEEVGQGDWEEEVEHYQQESKVEEEVEEQVEEEVEGQAEVEGQVEVEEQVEGGH